MKFSKKSFKKASLVMIAAVFGIIFPEIGVILLALFLFFAVYTIVYILFYAYESE